MLRFSGGTAGRSHIAHCVGFRVAALTALMKAVAAITSANWANMRPVRPGTKAAGMNTDISTRVMMITGIVVAGTSMARQSCRKITITIRTRTPASIRVMNTSLIEVLTKLVVSNGTL